MKRSAVKKDTEARNGSRSFVGTWVVTVPRPALPGGRHNLISFFADGTIITAQEAPLVPDREGVPFKLLYRSAGHGAWISPNPGTAKVTFVYMLNDEQGRSFGTAMVHSTMKLSKDGQTLSGKVAGNAADLAGKKTATDTHKVTGKRVVVSE